MSEKIQGFQMKKNLILLLITLFFSGCIHSVNQQGLTIRIPASQITQSLEQQFPVSQNFQYGTVALQNPKALLQAGSDRVQAGTTIGFSNALIPTQTGSLMISGKPIFDAKTGAVYLTQPSIDRLEFNGYKLASFMQGPLKDAIMPLINEVFRTRPIYRLDQNSLQSAFVKNIRVSNGELLLTFGL
ncbi:MAG TPA: DUF1439 domain-containing protein [Campylobacterales bacterium]|nr:DUF1439 domain-containing protein [Campylobacterales bacterium]